MSLKPTRTRLACLEKPSTHPYRAVAAERERAFVVVVGVRADGGRKTIPFSSQSPRRVEGRRDDQAARIVNPPPSRRERRSWLQ